MWEIADTYDDGSLSMATLKKGDIEIVIRAPSQEARDSLIEQIQGL